MKTGRTLKYLSLAIGLLVLSQIETACSNKEEMQSFAPPQAAAPMRADKGAVGDGRTGAEAERKVVVTHNLTLEVKDLPGAYKQAASLAVVYGGYAFDTNRYQNPDGTSAGKVRMRVPPDKVPAVLTELRKLGRIISEGTTGQDITEEYVDLEARLNNARASEARLQKMMETMTGKLDDVLAVERELTRVRGEVESMEARKRSWDTLTRTVEISVELVQPPKAMPAMRKIWDPIKTAFGEALESFANSLHYAIVFVGAFIPWLAILGGLVYGVVRFFKRRKKQQPAEKK